MKNALKYGTIASILALGFSAQSNAAILTHNGQVATSGAVGSVDYYNFTTTNTGNVRLETFSPDFDTVLHLFSGATPTQAGFIIRNDDDGTLSPSPLGFRNSLLNLELTAGDYVAAVGDFILTTEEAVSGINDSSAIGIGFGAYTLEVEGDFVALNGGGGNSTGGDGAGNGDGDSDGSDNGNGNGAGNGSGNGNGAGDGTGNGNGAGNGTGNGNGAGNGNPDVTVSEPLSLGLFGLAMVAFGAIRRRKV